jgi:hypothetical protein
LRGSTSPAIFLHLANSPFRGITAPSAFSPLCSANSPVPLLFFGGGDETLENGSRYNPSVISFIRDEWLYRQAKLRCVCVH